MEPILSVVIATYNYGRFLESAIRSVLTQCESNCVYADNRPILKVKGVEGAVELIIVDGGSTDDSVEIIKKYQDRIAWWVSEPDKGQSNAFNKGFAHAHGKYLTWLNADDLLVDGCLREVVAQLLTHPNCEWFSGNSYRFKDYNKAIMQIWWGPHIYPAFLQGANMPIAVYGPSSIFAKTLYERVGRIREDLHFIMDLDLWIRFAAAGALMRRINCFCWAFRMHEASKTAEYDDHHPPAQVSESFRVETQGYYAKSKYKVSRALHYGIVLLRFFDGSHLRRAYYKLVFRKHRGYD